MRDLRGKRFASTVGVWRVASNGLHSVLKHVALGAGQTANWPSEAEIASQYYWRREVEVYEDGLPAGTPFRLPGCAVFERPDGSVALWLEDLGDPTLPDVADLARRLAWMPVPAAPSPWLARTWLRRYLELRAAHFEPDLPAWRLREAIVERIEAGPPVFVHNDFHPGNIFGTDDPVVIDWAFCGIGVPGTDAGVLAGDSLFDGVVPAEEAGTLIDSVWESYAEALDPALVEEAEFAFFAGNALRYGWSARWSEHYAAVYRALASAAATRIPSLS